MQLGCGRCSEFLGLVREENGHLAALFLLGLRTQWVILAIVAIIGIIIMGNSYIAWTVCQTHRSKHFMEIDCWMLSITLRSVFHPIGTVKEAQSLERLSNLLVITQLESTRAWIPAQETWFQNSSKICHIVNFQALPEAPRESLPRLLGTIKA